MIEVYSSVQKGIFNLIRSHTFEIQIIYADLSLFSQLKQASKVVFFQID